MTILGLWFYQDAITESGSRTDIHFRPAHRLVGVLAVDRRGEEQKAMQALARQQPAYEDVAGQLRATAINLQGLDLPG